MSRSRVSGPAIWLVDSAAPFAVPCVRLTKRIAGATGSRTETAQIVQFSAAPVGYAVYVRCLGACCQFDFSSLSLWSNRARGASTEAWVKQKPCQAPGWNRCGLSSKNVSRCAVVCRDQRGLESRLHRLSSLPRSNKPRRQCSHCLPS